MFALLKEFALIVLLVLIGTSYSLLSNGEALPSRAGELEADAVGLEDARRMDPIWVDARSAEAFEAERVPDAIRLSEDNWDAGLMALMEVWLPTARPIVVYCGSESCGASRRIADRLRGALEDAEIYTLHGGWDAWQQR